MVQEEPPPVLPPVSPPELSSAGVDVDVVSSSLGKIKPQPASNRINIYIKNLRIPLRINPGE